MHCLDLERMEWLNVINQTSSNSYTGDISNGHNNTVNSQTNGCTRRVDGYRPEPRYGHSQITLDDERVLIVGGCGGPGKQYDDVWILDWPRDMSRNASWQKIVVENFINSPVQSYCIPFVQCETKLIMLGKPRSLSTSETNAATSNGQSSTNGVNGAAAIPLMSAGAAMANYELMSAAAPAETIATFRKASVVPRKCSCFSMQQQEQRTAEKKSEVFLKPSSSSNNLNSFDSLFFS